MKSIRSVKLVRVRGRTRQEVRDEVVVEEPLQIRVAQDKLMVTMRTPGDDARLTLGFLFGEGVIGHRDDIGQLAHCGRPDEEGYGNVIDATPGAGVTLDIDALSASRRTSTTTSACGVCGRASIEDLLARVTPVADGREVTARELERALAALEGAQENFARTGGLHAAAALDAGGDILAFAEDVGRHNAVDKVIGRLVADGRLPDPEGKHARLLAVSGRCSFEIVQKAAVARIPILVAVSAPSSLAVDLADAMGLTLVGFARGDGCNIYTHAERVVAS